MRRYVELASERAATLDILSQTDGSTSRAQTFHFQAGWQKAIKHYTRNRR